MTSLIRQGHQPISREKVHSGSNDRQFDPWIIWVTIRHCWAWAAPLGIVLACVAAFVVIRGFVPSYRASHLLEANEDFVVFRGVMPMLEDIAATEGALILNAVVIEPLLADPSLRKAPSLADPEMAEFNLRKNLRVNSGGTRRRMVVSYDDTDRDAAAMVCNAVVDSYLRIRAAFDSTRVSNLQRWLEPEISRWQEEVEQRRQSVQKLSEQTLGFAPGQRLSVLEDQSNLSVMAELRSQISDLNVQLALGDANRAMQNEAGGPVFTIPSDDAVLAVPVVARKNPTDDEILQAAAQDASIVEATTLMARYQRMMLDMEDNDLIRVRREYYEEIKAKYHQWSGKLESIKREAHERAIVALNQRADADFERQKAAAIASQKAMKEGAEAQRTARIEAARQQWQREQEEKLASEKRERDALSTKLTVLQNQYEEERARMEQFGGATAELQFAQEELEVATDVLTKLRERIAAIKTESRQDGAVRTLAPATPPKHAIENLPAKKLALASACAFAIPFLFGLLWELRVQRVTDSSAVDRSLALAPVVGEIAKLPSGKRSGKGRRIFEESVDALRANLFLSMDTGKIRSIAVVSSMSGEGKSSVASQLALSIAKATGKTVLLVDADLRYPDQHQIFGLEMGAGLAGVLSQKATLNEAIDTSLGNLLHVLPAGRLDRSPHRLISQSSMRDFVDQALETYSFVVIDTAPVLSASESLAVASTADTTLLCVMRDVSRLDSVTRSMKRLEAAGATVAGTVFSGVTAGQYAYRYGNYHYAIAADQGVS